MQTALLDFSYPTELVATEPRQDYRILLTNLRASRPTTPPTTPTAIQPAELKHQELLNLFKPHDVLVINDTRVLKRRIYGENLEILFLEDEGSNVWSVLFSARDTKTGEKISLPGGRSATLLQKGLPQKIEVDAPLTQTYFEQYGEFALPPYIQKARGERHSRDQDSHWYQSAWAQEPGSCAAPTASLHFSQADLDILRAKGVVIAPLTLHVGIGTFLPVKTETLSNHVMHKEWAQLPAQTIRALQTARENGARVWALGTTVARALESFGQNMLQRQADGHFAGESDLFIRPGYEWQWVDVLLTNFHQPKSTLLSLVAAFAGLEQTLASYHYAVERRFRLFSYGDLSVWIK